MAALALALPTAATGAGVSGSVVPPENSAATQYTEAIPTAGGDKQTGEGGKKPSPTKVLGTKNAHRLESQGKQGREVAEVVAETAPETSASPEATPPAEAQPRHESSGNGSGEAKGHGKAQAPPAKPHGKADRSHPEAPAAEPPQTATELPSGSSALGEVVAAMTGSSSSGRLGGLLPLAIAAAIAWAFAFFWRQRRQAG